MVAFGIGRVASLTEIATFALAGTGLVKMYLLIIS
jgi:hypothetical protein